MTLHRVFLMALLTCLCGSLGSTALASHTWRPIEKKVEAVVVREMDNLLSQIYDESAGANTSANVESVNCKMRDRNNGGYVAYCSADVEVQPHRRSTYKNTVCCTALRYNVAADLKSVELVDGAEACTDLVNSVSAP